MLSVDLLIGIAIGSIACFTTDFIMYYVCGWRFYKVRKD